MAILIPLWKWFVYRQWMWQFGFSSTDSPTRKLDPWQGLQDGLWADNFRWKSLRGFQSPALWSGELPAHLLRSQNTWRFFFGCRKQRQHRSAALLACRRRQRRDAFEPLASRKDGHSAPVIAWHPVSKWAVFKTFQNLCWLMVKGDLYHPIYWGS